MNLAGRLVTSVTETSVRMSMAPNHSRVGPSSPSTSLTPPSKRWSLSLLSPDDQKLSGLLPLAALVKRCNVEELPLLIAYFKTQLDELGVKVNLGKEVNRSLVEELKPDVVI